MGEHGSRPPADFRAGPGKKDLEVAPIAERHVEVVEFARLPDQIKPQEILQNTVAFLIDLKTIVDDELRMSGVLAKEQKVAISEAHTKVHLFISSIMGAKEKYGAVTYNEKALRINLEDIPEDIFQAITLLAREIPEAYDELFEDPARYHTSDVFDPQYHLLYTIFQKALREVSNATSFTQKNNCRMERITLLSDVRGEKRKHRIDRSRPLPIDLAEVNADRMNVCSENLIELIEKKQDELPRDLRKDVQTILSFLRACVSPQVAHTRLQERGTPDDDRAFFARYHDFVEHPETLDMSRIPTSVVEAASRIGMVDHEIHLALLGHNVSMDQSALVDSTGQRVSALEREHAYHPLTIAAQNTVRKEALHKKYGLASDTEKEAMEEIYGSAMLAGPSVTELYKLDDLLATGTNGDLVQLLSAKDYAQVVAILGTADRTGVKTGFAKVWEILNKPIGELFARRQRNRREARDKAVVDDWIAELRDVAMRVINENQPKDEARSDGVGTDFAREFERQVNHILDEMREHPHLERVDLVEAMVTILHTLARLVSTHFATDVEKLGQRYLPHKTLGKGNRISSVEFAQNMRKAVKVYGELKRASIARHVRAHSGAEDKLKQLSGSQTRIDSQRDFASARHVPGNENVFSGFIDNETLRYIILDIIEQVKNEAGQFSDSFAEEVSTMAEKYKSDDLFGYARIDELIKIKHKDQSYAEFCHRKGEMIQPDYEILIRAVDIMKKARECFDGYSPANPQDSSGRGEPTDHRNEDGSVEDDFYTTGAFVDMFEQALTKMQVTHDGTATDDIIPFVVSAYLGDMLKTIEMERIPIAGGIMEPIPISGGIQKTVQEVKAYFDHMPILEDEKKSQGSKQYMIDYLRQVLAYYREVVQLDATYREVSPIKRLDGIRNMLQDRHQRQKAERDERERRGYDRNRYDDMRFPRRGLGILQETDAVLYDMTETSSPEIAHSIRYDLEAKRRDNYLESMIDRVEVAIRQKSLEYGQGGYDVVEKKNYKKVAELSSLELEGVGLKYTGISPLFISADGTIYIGASPVFRVSRHGGEEFPVVQPRLYAWSHKDGKWKEGRKIVLKRQEEQECISEKTSKGKDFQHARGLDDFFVTPKGDIVAKILDFDSKMIKGRVAKVRVFDSSGNLKKDGANEYTGQLGVESPLRSLNRDRQVSDRDMLVSDKDDSPLFSPELEAFLARQDNATPATGGMHDYTKDVQIPAFRFGESSITVYDGQLCELINKQDARIGHWRNLKRNTRTTRDFDKALKEKSGRRAAKFHAATEHLLVSENSGGVFDANLAFARINPNVTNPDEAILQYGEYRRNKQKSKDKIWKESMFGFRYVDLQIVGKERVAVHLREHLKSDKILFLRPESDAENAPWIEEQEIDTGTVFDNFKVLPDGKVVISGRFGDDLMKPGVMIFDGDLVNT